MKSDHIQRAALVALLGIVLAACGSNSQAGQPTALPSSQPSPAATASPVPAATSRPAPAATNAPAATAAPAAKPVIGFNPQSGAPGTIVSVFGSGYLPGAPVSVRLGLPQPTGEVLASAFADASGRWSASLTIPDRLPSGEVIGGTPVYLVAMSDQNLALASAPFGFTAVRPVPARAEAPQAVRDLLAAVGKRDVTPFLAWNLRDQLSAGRPLDQVLGLHPIALNAADVRDPEDRPADVLFVPATLSYQGFSEERLFMLVVEDGRWKVTESQRVQNPAPAQPADALDAVRLFLTFTQADRSMRQASYYLGNRLRAQVLSGQIRDAGAILDEQNPFSSFRVDRVVSTDVENSYVQATLLYGDGAVQAKRLFMVSQREERAWRIFNVTITDGVDDPGPQGSWPGPGWQMLATGDFNADGLEETIFFREANLSTASRFHDDYLTQNARVVSEVLIAQPAAHGPQIMFRADLASARTADRVLVPFATAELPQAPAAFLMAVDPARTVFLNLLPLRADGNGHSPVIGIQWSQAEGGYRLAAPDVA